MNASHIFVVVLFVNGAVINGRICPSSIKEIQQDVTMYESVRYGHYIELDCCSREGSQLNWMKWNKMTEQWQNYLPDGKDIRFLDNKHILAIQSSTFDDIGLYKCSVQNGSSTMHVKTFQLDVIACDKLARGPYPIAPLSCSETMATEKETLTLPCTGYFGCGEEDDIRIVTWYVSDNQYKTDNWVEATSIDKRYQMTDFQEDGGTVIGSNLTIDGVSGVDFNRKFMCVLATPQLVKGQSKLVVTLRKDLSGTSSLFQSGFSALEVLVVVVSVAAVALIVTVVVCGASFRNRLKRKKQSRKTDTGLNWALTADRDIEDTGDMIESVD